MRELVFLAAVVVWTPSALAQRGTDEDSDGDGRSDENDDNCPGVSNPTQADRDGDAVGDACDRCPDQHNPRDQTGRQPECRPGGGDDDPARADGARCVSGELEGVTWKRTLWFVQPVAAIYTTGFDDDAARMTAGVRGFLLWNIDGATCREDEVDIAGRKPIELDLPEWYARAGIYLDPALNERSSLGLELGVDYAPVEGRLSSVTLGVQTHVLVTDADDEATAVHLGVGLRASVLDVLGIAPFVQCDVKGDLGTSIGTFVSFDLETLDDLGMNRSALRGSRR